MTKAARMHAVASCKLERRFAPAPHAPNISVSTGNEPVNCTAHELDEFLSNLAEGYLPCVSSELCTSSPGLAEGFLATYYSDTSPSVQSKSMSIASKSYQRGKKTVVFHGFPSIQMSRNSTADHGAGLLTWFRGASHARTYQPQGEAQELKASIAGCGEKWHESSVKYCPVLSSWKTHLSLWEEALQWSSVILPRWGMTRNGVVFRHPTWERPISAIGFGLQPDNESFFHTPTCGGMDGGSNSRKALKKRQEAFATPQARDYRSGQASRWDDPARSRNLNDQIAKYPTMMVSEENGRLNPEFVEWLMGWPQGWTDLKPLGMDRCHCAQPLHGNCSRKDFDCWERHFMKQLETYTAKVSNGKDKSSK